MLKTLKHPPSKTARNIVSVLGIDIDSGRKDQVLKRALGLFLLRKQQTSLSVPEGKASYIVTPNPEIVSRAQADRGLARILNKADLSIPDGIGIVAAAWLLNGNNKLTRIPGRLLALDLVEFCAKNDKKVFLLGGQPGSAEKAANNIVSNFKFKISNLKFSQGPWLDNSGKPIDKTQEKIEKEVIKKINDFSPDLLLVGFGAPKQEKWLWRHLGKINIQVAMVVGGMIDYTAGILPAPPRAFSELGFEWLWRLITQPRRLSRILTAVVVFSWQVFFWKLKKQ